MNKFWFSGVWLLPISGALGWAFAELSRTLRSLVTLLQGDSLPPYTHTEILLWVAITNVPFVILLLVHVVQLLLLDRTNFAPEKFQSKQVMSKEKRRVTYTTPPKNFLSNSCNGVVVGKFKNKFVRIKMTDPREIYNGLIIGNPGSGKSSAVYLPTLISNFMQKNPTPCFIIDTNGELSYKGFKYDNPAIKIIDPTDRSDYVYGYDVFSNVNQSMTDTRILRDAIKPMSKALIVDSDPKNQFFVHNARTIFCGLMLYYYRKQVWTDDNNEIQHGFVDAVAKIASDDVLEHIQEVLKDKNIVKKHKTIKHLIKKYLNEDSEALTGIKLQLQEGLDEFLDDDVKWFLQDNPNKCSIEQLLYDHKSICLRIPESELDNFSVSFRLIVCQLFRAIEKRPEGSYPILILLDEFPRLGKIESIETCLATSRKRGISLWLSAQSITQLQKIYGENISQTIVYLCQIIAVMSGTDAEFGKLMSAWAGDFEEVRISRNRNSISHISDNRESVSQSYRPVVQTSDLMNLRETGEVALILDGHFSRVKKFNYFKDSLLNSQSQKIQKKNDQIRQQSCRNFYSFNDSETLTEDDLEEIISDDF